MPTPLVSVLLPVYNAAPTLDEALGTLCGQTLDDLEIVAVDDGSDDGSAAVLSRWQQRDPRLRPCFEAHRGLIPTLNRGLELCRAPYLARMDADDRCHPQRLELQVEALDADASIGVVGSLVELFADGEVGAGFRIYVDWQNGLCEHADICREMFIESPLVHPSVVMRRAELRDLGGYQERGWAEDYDLWLRYRSTGRRFAKVRRTLLYWREHGGRLTRTDGRYSVENFLRAKAHYLIAGPLTDRGALLIWGAGRTGRRLSKHLIRGGWQPEAFVDVDPAKVGGSLRGAPVVGPAELPGLWQRCRRPLLITAVSSRGARRLIRAELARLDLREGEDFLCAA